MTTDNDFAEVYTHPAIHQALAYLAGYTGLLKELGVPQEVIDSKLSVIGLC